MAQLEKPSPQHSEAGASAIRQVGLTVPHMLAQAYRKAAHLSGSDDEFISVKTYDTPSFAAASQEDDLVHSDTEAPHNHAGRLLQQVQLLKDHGAKLEKADAGFAKKRKRSTKRRTKA